MVEKLKAEEVNKHTDPAVAKQYDTETPKTAQWQELYEIVDKLKIGLLGTMRPNIGVSEHDHGSCELTADMSSAFGAQHGHCKA